MSKVDELHRLRANFEVQASRYPDLTLTVDIISSAGPNDRVFRKPNHTISLWQVSSFGTEANLAEAMIDMLKHHTKFGVPAELSAMGTIEGLDTALFRKMATRAATLIPKATQDTLSEQLNNSLLSTLKAEGKTVVVLNSNPLAVWLNLILTTLATFQRERLQSLTLAVDPFAASLAVFDYFLLPSTPDVDASRFSKQAPQVRTPIIVSRADTSEPTLADVTYEKILDVVMRMGLDMERHPATHLGKSEEHLRDLLLIVLSTHFDSATGETFNRAGKTDVLVRRQGTNLFVAECKIWRGEKEYLEALDQLLSYLTWRDSKSALIIFVRNKQLQPVLDTISKETLSHHCYQASIQQKGKQEGIQRFLFRLPQDSSRSVSVTVICFHFPEQ